jgi:hypothetical protein
MSRAKQFIESVDTLGTTNGQEGPLGPIDADAEYDKLSNSLLAIKSNIKLEQDKINMFTKMLANIKDPVQKKTKQDRINTARQRISDLQVELVKKNQIFQDLNKKPEEAAGGAGGAGAGASSGGTSSGATMGCSGALKASGPTGGTGNSNVNDLGKIPENPLSWYKKRKKKSVVVAK